MLRRKNSFFNYYIILFLAWSTISLLDDHVSCDSSGETFQPNRHLDDIVLPPPRNKVGLAMNLFETYYHNKVHRSSQQNLEGLPKRQRTDSGEGPPQKRQRTEFGQGIDDLTVTKPGYVTKMKMKSLLKRDPERHARLQQDLVELNHLDPKALIDKEFVGSIMSKAREKKVDVGVNMAINMLASTNPYVKFVSKVTDSIIEKNPEMIQRFTGIKHE